MTDLIKLKNEFHELFLIEKQAHDLYENYIRDLDDGHAKEVLTTIHDQEEKHMRIATEIVNIIEENNEN